jgi:hypothetical protein
MNSGNKMNLLVAEHVFGWTWQVVPRHIHIVGEDALKIEGDDAIALMPPNSVFPPHEVGQGRLFYQAVVADYSGSVLQATKVLDRYNDFTLTKEENNMVSCRLPTSRRDRQGHSICVGHTLAEAVCLTALDAEGYDTTTES